MAGLCRPLLFPCIYQCHRTVSPPVAVSTPGLGPGNEFTDNGRANPQSPDNLCAQTPNLNAGCRRSEAELRFQECWGRKAVESPCICRVTEGPLVPQGDAPPAQLEWLRRDPLSKRP